jgi:hypothetical protein
VSTVGDGSTRALSRYETVGTPSKIQVLQALRKTVCAIWLPSISVRGIGLETQNIPSRVVNGKLVAASIGYGRCQEQALRRTVKVVESIDVFNLVKRSGKH